MDPAEECLAGERRVGRGWLGRRRRVERGSTRRAGEDSGTMTPHGCGRVLVLGTVDRSRQLIVACRV